MSVVGSISIKDNVTATLRIIKKEQTSFREDVKKTREEMEKYVNSLSKEESGETLISRQYFDSTL